MIETSEKVGHIAAALHAAQGLIAGVVKDAKNPHFKSRYATLEAVIDTAKPALQSASLSFVQAPGRITEAGAVEITTMIVHTSGEWMRSTLHVPLAKKDPQGVGSSITYGCRYALMAMLGLPPVDDDAESAMDRSPHKQPDAPRVKPSASDYMTLAREAVFLAKTPEDIVTWWKGEAPARIQHGIVDGTAEYAELVELCAQQKTRINKAA